MPDLILALLIVGALLLACGAIALEARSVVRDRLRLELHGDDWRGEGNSR